MIALAYYMLKVGICSGLLFIYYIAALRNKAFHQWSRFYLLVSVLLSLLLPLSFFEFLPSEQPDNNAINIVYTANNYLQAFNPQAEGKHPSFPWLEAGYGATCLVLFLSLLRTLWRILKIRNSHEEQNVNGVRLLNTAEPGTPFSFINYLFWNKHIDLYSPSGQRIFSHELVHIKERHTLDKLFMQLVLIIAWANPFFWLIRKELSVIHEFTADEKAARQHGTAALAAMILQAAFPEQFHKITSPFFHSSIKRRFIMLTKMQNKRLAYAGRIAALPVMAFIILAFTVKNKETGTQLDRSVAAIQSVKNYVSATGNTIVKDISVQQRDTLPKGKTGAAGAIYVIDGVIQRDESGLKALNSNMIRTINVLKDESATNKYGEQGKNGVIEIITKKKNAGANEIVIVDGVSRQDADLKKMDGNNIASVNVIKGKESKLDRRVENIIQITTKSGRETNDSAVIIRKTGGPQPLFIIDGTVANEAAMKAMDTNNIESVSVLKGEAATSKYGDQGKNGVIEITSKAGKAPTTQAQPVTFKKEENNSR